MSKVHFVTISIAVKSESEERPTDAEIINKLKECMPDDETLNLNFETEYCEDLSNIDLPDEVS